MGLEVSGWALTPYGEVLLSTQPMLRGAICSLQTGGVGVGRQECPDETKQVHIPLSDLDGLFPTSGLWGRP